MHSSQELNEVREGLLENYTTLDCTIIDHLRCGKFPHICFNITVNSCKVSQLKGDICDQLKSKYPLIYLTKLVTGDLI